MTNDLHNCAALVERADPDRFRAAMAAPASARAVLFPLYAFNVEVSRAPWVTAEAMIAEMRLQWWRDALAEIAAGGAVRRHEVVTPLAKVLTPEVAQLLDGFVEVRRWDIYSEPFEDQAHFDDYLNQTGGMFFKALCIASAVPDQGAESFGRAVAIANWLRAIPELEQRGRIPLLDGSPAGVKALAQSGLDALRQARRAGVDRKARPALLAGWQAGALLRQAAVDPGRVAEGTLGQSEARRKLTLMARAATGRW